MRIPENTDNHYEDIVEIGERGFVTVSERLASD
jgi:hypothetical protein